MLARSCAEHCLVNSPKCTPATSSPSPAPDPRFIVGRGHVWEKGDRVRWKGAKERYAGRGGEAEEEFKVE